MTHHCHVGDSADSMGSGVNPEKSSFFKSEIYFFLRGLNPKVHYTINLFFIQHLSL